MELPQVSIYFKCSSEMLSRTSSQMCGRWYLPIFLFRDGLLILIIGLLLLFLRGFGLPSPVWKSCQLWHCDLEQDFLRPRRSHDRIWRKLVLQLKYLFCFRENIKITWYQTEWETSTHIGVINYSLVEYNSGNLFLYWRDGIVKYVHIVLVSYY